MLISRRDVRLKSVHHINDSIVLYGECNPARAQSTIEKACALLLDTTLIEFSVDVANKYLEGSGLTLTFGEKYWDTWYPETGTTGLELDYYVRLSSGKGEKDCHGPGGRGFSNSDVRCSTLEQVNKTVDLFISPYVDREIEQNIVKICSEIDIDVNFYKDNDTIHLVADNGFVICKGDTFRELWDKFYGIYTRYSQPS